MHKLHAVTDLLIEQKPLPRKYYDHSLSGKYKGHRECHIQPDWLLIYKIVGDVIIFERMGSHADLFN